ncbi:MAG: leucine-rich repeat protein [Alphaproteobacteria bacterium]|nr:leucine-rich repeat protein [Alphaproteobacteria bacterium]
MRKSQFIFALMLSTSFATMARADDTSSLANCEDHAGKGNCVQIGTSGTYYALSGAANNQTMTIYGTKGSESNAATVPEYAFYDDESWESTVPVGVTSLKTSGNVNIGEYAFYGASGLTSANLTGVQTIGRGAFGSEPDFGLTCGLTSIDLTGVQTIGNYAFSGATGLTGHLDLSGVQSIGDDAFSSTGLTSVNLTGVQTIGRAAFFKTTNLTSVDLTGVQSIGYGAFMDATGLTSVVISDSLLDSNGNILGYSCDVNNVCAGIGIYDFEESGLSTIYCPTDRTCGNNFMGLSDTPTIISYSKNDDGTYSVGDNTYANADMMTKGITCEGAQCTALRTALDAGGTCSTQDACNTLAAEYATPQPTKPQRADIRIYTIEEANAVAGKVNRVSIKYR